MGAVPKHKTSTQRKGKRRANKNLDKKQVIACPNCGAPKLNHQACSQCGFYKP
jgi:large subunit ribosomal protein L32